MTVGIPGAVKHFHGATLARLSQNLAALGLSGGAGDRAAEAEARLREAVQLVSPWPTSLKHYQDLRIALPMSCEIAVLQSSFAVCCCRAKSPDNADGWLELGLLLEQKAGPPPGRGDGSKHR